MAESLTPDDDPESLRLWLEMGSAIAAIELFVLGTNGHLTMDGTPDGQQVASTRPVAVRGSREDQVTVAAFRCAAGASAARAPDAAPRGSRRPMQRISDRVT